MKKHLSLSEEKIKKLCSVIGGKWDKPETSSTYHRCVMDGTEKLSPFIFYDLNGIMEGKRWLNIGKERIENEKERMKNELKDTFEYAKKYKKQIKERESSIYRGVDFYRVYGNEEQREKAEKIKHEL